MKALVHNETRLTILLRKIKCIVNKKLSYLFPAYKTHLMGKDMKGMEICCGRNTNTCMKANEARLQAVTFDDYYSTY